MGVGRSVRIPLVEKVLGGGRRRAIKRSQVITERTISERGEQSGSDGAAHLDAAQEKEFRALASQWHHETDHHSSTSIIQSHPALQKIIRMGAPAVPLILRELNEGRDGHWFQALRTLTGENPVAKDSSYDACRAAWLAWGRKRGLIA